MKILILGGMRSGKDTFAELLGVSYESSSKSALDVFLFDRLAELGLKYESKEAAFEDRVNHRDVWHREIAEYNTPDKSKLARGIIANSDCYVGMRCNEEYKACMDEGMFDRVYWVDASDRVPPEPSSSFNIEFDEDSMDYIDNNFDLFNLETQALLEAQYLGVVT